MGELTPLLNVEDVSRSLAFYEKTVGAVLENQWEFEGRLRWARVAFDGGALMLNSPDGVDSSARRGRGEFTDVVLYLGCDDAARERERLAGAGLEVGALSSESYGNLEFSVRDPDGYVLRFSSPAA